MARGVNTDIPDGGRGYGPLLRTPGALGFSLAGLVGRMPISMLSIGTVLLVQDRRDSFALAGLVGAAYALGLAGLGPLVSRLVDRRGQRRVLPATLVVSAVGILAVVLLAGSSAPAVWLVLAATVMSASSSQLGSCARARWSALLVDRPSELPRAYAWEAVVDEVVFVLGPLVVVMCAVIDPAVGLFAALALGTGGMLAFLAQQSTEPAVHVWDGAPRKSAMSSSGLRAVVVAMLFVGVLFGTVEVGLVAFAEERDSTYGAGLLLALVAGGSALSGLAYGLLHLRAPLHRRYLLNIALLAAGLVPLLLAPSIGFMAPAALLAGIAISPTLIAAFGLVENLVPAASRTEGFSWLNSGLGVGVALGFAASGAVADAAGARHAFFIAFAGALVAGLVALLAQGPMSAKVAAAPVRA